MIQELEAFSLRLSFQLSDSANCALLTRIQYRRIPPNLDPQFRYRHHDPLAKLGWLHNKQAHAKPLIVCAVICFNQILAFNPFSFT